MNKKIIIVGVAVVVAAGAWMLARNNYSASDQPSAYPEASAPPPSTPAAAQTPPVNPQASQPAAPSAGGAAVKEFTVTGQNYSFTPSALTVKKGDTVKIIFKDDDGVHDLKIDAFNAGTQRIRTGQKETVTFVADKTGSYEYYCSVGSHRGLGMKGALTVTN